VPAIQRAGPVPAIDRSSFRKLAGLAGSFIPGADRYLPPTRPTMANATHDEVLDATRMWLRPVIHILLRSGITWREFSELSKRTYVEVATRHFGRRGRPTNVSRTAASTGLARREVRKQRDLLESGGTSPVPYVTKASLVLSAWHLLPEYRGRSSRPVVLDFDGERRSFMALVEACGGSDVPPTTLLKELVTAGAVRVRADGRLEATGRNYIPHAMDGQMIRLWGSVLADVATTHVHNLSRTAKVAARFERAAVNDEVDASAVPEFRRFLEAEGQAFLERVDAWLSAHQVSSARRATKTHPVRLGAGVYHVQDL
jgi:hypothetical protein